MARRADDFDDHELLVTDENSELSDAALAVSFSAWLRELDEQGPQRVSVRAADTLAEARAAGEV
ncbi:MAG: hypothetical protein R2755_27130 [Acidimicrobiales bacterium]